MTPQNAKRIANIASLAALAAFAVWFVLTIAAAVLKDFAINEGLARDLSRVAAVAFVGSLITAGAVILARVSGLLPPFTREQKQAIQDGLAERPRRYWLKIVLWTLAGLFLVFLFNVLQGAGVTKVAIPNSVSNFATEAGPLIALAIIWIAFMVRARRAQARKKTSGSEQ